MADAAAVVLSGRPSGGFSPAHRGGNGPPLLLVHGFLASWRAWELVLGRLQRRHEVLAVTLPGHAGGLPLPTDRESLVGRSLEDVFLGHLERALDKAGWATAHVAGNSLGGYLALKLAQRGRARSVVTLAPAGGWAPGDPGASNLFDLQHRLHAQLVEVAPYADALVATPAGRRAAAGSVVVDGEAIPAKLLAHELRAGAACDAQTLLEHARRMSWTIDGERIGCPVRVVWGTADRLLPWPTWAVRYRERWLPHADWVVLDGVGHCPQLDVPLQTAELIAGWTGA